MLRKRYETLRAAALGGGLPLEARSGLALFLRRGLWGWAQAAAVPSMPPRSTCNGSARTIADHDHRAVVRLFAAMAMSSTNRRTHEPIHQSPIAPSRA